MAKGKPRWKDLTFEERLVKRVKRMGASESTIQHLQERMKRKQMEGQIENKSAIAPSAVALKYVSLATKSEPLKNDTSILPSG